MWGDWSGLVALSQSVGLPTDWLDSLSQNQGLSTDWLSSLSQNTGLPVEWLKDFSKSENSNIMNDLLNSIIYNRPYPQRITKKILYRCIKEDANLVRISLLRAILIRNYGRKICNMLDENEKSILKVITMGTLDDKKAIFESLRNENLELLNEIDSNGIQDKISETIEKINKMDFEEGSTIKDVTSLIKLKESLT